MSLPSYVSTSDLRERLELWRAIAELCRDRQESSLIHGHTITAAAIDFGADGIETCIEDIEGLIAEAEGIAVDHS